MIPSSKIRVLVLGCGNMGSSHAKAYHNSASFELVGLLARSPKRRTPLALELGGVDEFDNLDTAIQQARPDAVAICTYPDTHAEYARKCLHAGLHLFVEKPIAETVEEAQEIVALAAKTQKKVVIGYILRHHPAWKQFIEISHTLGKPLVMRMNLNQQSKGEEWRVHKELMNSMSPIVDCGVHYVDIMCQMTKSQPVQVQAVGARISDEIHESMYNYGQLQVVFEDKSVGWYEAGWGPMMSEVAYFVKDVIGPLGSVSIVEPGNKGGGASDDIDSHTRTNCLLVHKAETDNTGNFRFPDQEISTADEPDHQALCDLEQDFFRRAIEEDLNLEDHLRDAVNSLKIVLAADRSIRTGEVVKINN